MFRIVVVITSALLVPSLALAGRRRRRARRRGGRGDEIRPSLEGAPASRDRARHRDRERRPRARRARAQAVELDFYQDTYAVECHGNLARGMRVGDARSTYQPILALEPEKTDAFAAGRTEANAYELLFLAKPLARERHRPGPSLTKGEPAERCLTSWLVGPVDAKICSDALVK